MGQTGKGRLDLDGAVRIAVKSELKKVKKLNKARSSVPITASSRRTSQMNTPDAPVALPDRSPAARSLKRSGKRLEKVRRKAARSSVPSVAYSPGSKVTAVAKRRTKPSPWIRSVKKTAPAKSAAGPAANNERPSSDPSASGTHQNTATSDPGSDLKDRLKKQYLKSRRDSWKRYVR